MGVIVAQIRVGVFGDAELSRFIERRRLIIPATYETLQPNTQVRVAAWP
jgi:hypothetical protein